MLINKTQYYDIYYDTTMLMKMTETLTLLWGSPAFCILFDMLYTVCVYMYVC